MADENWLDDLARSVCGSVSRREALRRMAGGLAGALFASIGGFSPATSAQSAVSFDDSGPNTVRLANSHYELALSKTNGAILALTDKRAGASLTLGSRDGCLWGGLFNTGGVPDFVGGCNYSVSDANRFAYAWNPASGTLTLSYAGDVSAGPHVNAVVSIVVTDQPQIDLRLQLENRWGRELYATLLPASLVFARGAVQWAYGPFVLPGARLSRSFFQEFLVGGRSFTVTYPCDRAFADYLALDVAGGRLAVYTVNPDGPIEPALLGFVDNDASQAGTFLLHHIWHTAVPDGAIYASPIIRLRIGQSAQQTILAYRNDNGIDKYPSVAEKLGARFEAVARGPMVKADVTHIGKPFRDWAPDLDRLPSASLLHVAGFQPRGDGENYPDVLPPDPKWGSTAEFRTMVEAARARGLLVAPLTNPTWWDEESPTLQALPSGLNAEGLAVWQSPGGDPVYVCYPRDCASGGPHGGYVLCPYHSFVQQRIAQSMAQWRDDVPVDFVLIDQIGSRDWYRDFNPSALGTLGYSDGWLAFLATYASQRLMTEMGWDRLARSAIGFHGSLLTWAREFGYADISWGDGNWEPYPLAVWLLHDKVLFYQHDLSHLTMLPPDRDQTMSDGKALLTWNAAFGTSFTYRWGRTFLGDTLDNPWLDLVTALQRAVASLYAGRPISDFGYLAAAVTSTSFGNLRIVGNWQPAATYEFEDHKIAPRGFLARTDSKSVVAGVFSGTFNGERLGSGDHYLVVERAATAVTVRKPLGEDTDLTVDAPDAWQSGQPLEVWPYDRRGNRLDRAAASIEGRRVKFTYVQNRLGKSVGRYELAVGTGPGGVSCPIPTASITKPKPAVQPKRQVKFAARLEAGKKCKIKSIQWSFGDGQTSTQNRGKHTYASAGTYRVTVTVTDSADQTASASVDITVP